MAKEEVKAADINAAKLKALQATIDKIEKDYGKGTIMKLGDQPEWSDAQVIPSGSVALDHALGIGGYPRGRIVEIYGPESSGKTTLAIHAIAQAQKSGGIAAMIDAEHAFDPTTEAIGGGHHAKSNCDRIGTGNAAAGRGADSGGGCGDPDYRYRVSYDRAG